AHGAVADGGERGTDEDRVQAHGWGPPRWASSAVERGMTYSRRNLSNWEALRARFCPSGWGSPTRPEGFSSRAVWRPDGKGSTIAPKPFRLSRLRRFASASSF